MVIVVGVVFNLKKTTRGNEVRRRGWRDKEIPVAE
jgi:hypothetical protein